MLIPNILIPIVNSIALTTKGKNNPNITPDTNKPMPLNKVHLKYDLLITHNKTTIIIIHIIQIILVKLLLKISYILINCFVLGVLV